MIAAVQSQLPQAILLSVEQSHTAALRPSEAPTNTTFSQKRSAKVPDVRKLSNNVDPIFKQWKVAIQGKLLVNADHFDNKETKMYYVYNATERDA